MFKPAEKKQDFEFIADLYNRNNRYLIHESIRAEDILQSRKKHKKNRIDYIIGQSYGWLCFIKLNDRLRFILVIDKPYQGKGYGKKAMRFIEKECKRLECKEIECDVFQNNKKAIGLYKQFGYDEVVRVVSMKKSMSNNETRK